MTVLISDQSREMGQAGVSAFPKDPWPRDGQKRQTLSLRAQTPFGPPHSLVDVSLP